MTTFEVKKRDGLARKGIFIQDEVRTDTPSVIDAETVFPSLSECTSCNIPLSAGKEFTKMYEWCGEGQPVWVHPEGSCAPDHGDVVLVRNWHTASGNPRNYVNWLTALKSRVFPDAAWYAPAAALPSDIAILCYSGFDFFDFTGVDLCSVQGKFCLPEGNFTGDLLLSGVCTCRGCGQGDLQTHNRMALLREVALVTKYIGMGQLRELVESRCRLHSWQVAVLRHLDNNYPFIEKSVPVVRDCALGATTGETLNRVEVRRFADRVIGRYVPPEADVTVLLPCSAKKPYSLSQSHRRFAQAINSRALELIVTSPLGPVPRELENIYPAAHYDVPVTGHWDAEEKAFLSSVVARYFERHTESRYIAHLGGGALDVVMMAAERTGTEVEITCDGHPTSPESIQSLENALSGLKKVRHNLVRGTCSWQFDCVPDIKGMTIRGRYPEIAVMKDRTPLFSLDTGTGLLKPTFAGWEYISSGYRVYIDDFVPQGDILAPGVNGADPAIREGDEVLVIGPRALATGRASMNAEEMERSARGVAVRVRKIKNVKMQ